MRPARRAAVGAALLFLTTAGCLHSRTRSGLTAAAAEALECPEAQLQITEYLDYPTQGSKVEGCKRIGGFEYLNGRWRLSSRCTFRVTPDIRSDHSPSRGGEVTCARECSDIEACASLPRASP